jgi:hypothetical protein
MSVVLILLLIFPLLIAFWGWQILRGKEEWYQILYSRLPRMNDSFIAKHHQALGLCYLIIGLLGAILLLVLGLNS